MEIVGYTLVDTRDGSIVKQWGGVWGQCPSVPNPVVLPNGDQICAPVINEDYQGYKLEEWRMDEPPAPVPQQVPMWAVRTVLQNDGLFDQAQTIIEASTENALKNIWEYGNFAERNSPAINSLGSALGLTDAQIDQMFIDANAITV